MTNLGASIGTALAGAVLIPALTASFLSGIQQNPAVPKEVAATAPVQLSGGIPFVADNDLKAALDKAGVPAETANAIVKENSDARSVPRPPAYDASARCCIERTRGDRRTIDQ